MKKHLFALVIGLAFGLVISLAGMSDYDQIKAMLMVEDLRLYGMMMTALAIAVPGIWWLRRGDRKSSLGEPIVIEPMPLKLKTLVGSVLFGLGWAMTGACPGPILVQLGEGKLLAIVTLAGALLGAFGAVVLEQKVPALDRELPLLPLAGELSQLPEK